MKRLSHDRQLYVILPYFNPTGSKRRETLLCNSVHYAGREQYVWPIVVQVAYPGQRHVEVGPYSNGGFSDVRLQAQNVMFHKENLINIGLEYVPSDGKYAWIDADVMFSNPHWVYDTVNALDKYDAVQLFGDTIDLCPKQSPFPPLIGAVKYMLEGKQDSAKHPVGLAWAAKKTSVPRFYDRCILDGGDSVFMNDYSLGNLGYIEGLCLHYWHGSRKNRQGRPDKFRFSVFKEVGFDVEKDLVYRAGVLDFADMAHPPTQKIAELCKEYFQARKDDSQEVTGDESKI